jgi:hypothetical protein
MNGDFDLVHPVASVISQEGEQNSFYCSMLSKVLDALPLLTTGTREFAFSSLVQTFAIPGSCPNINTIPLPIFAPLTLVTAPIAPDIQTLEFSFVVNEHAPLVNSSSLSLVHINQQNLPIVEPLQSLAQQGNAVTFSANFPYDQFVVNGLTLANVVHGAGPFTSASAVANSNVYRPALIEIN